MNLDLPVDPIDLLLWSDFKCASQPSEGWSGRRRGTREQSIRPLMTGATPREEEGQTTSTIEGDGEEERRTEGWRTRGGDGKEKADLTPNFSCSLCLVHTLTHVHVLQHLIFISEH